jgi:hypothetical protein
MTPIPDIAQSEPCERFQQAANTQGHNSTTTTTVVAMNVTPQRFAASDLSIDRTGMHPKSVFCEGDRIQVHGKKTMHHGRIARIDKIGDRRITCTFEDGVWGKYVDFFDALLIPERGNEAVSATPRLRATATTIPRSPRQRVAPRRTPQVARDSRSSRTRLPPNAGNVPVRNHGSLIRASLTYDPPTQDNAQSFRTPRDMTDAMEPSDSEDDEDGNEVLLTQATINNNTANDRVLDQFSITAATLITQCADPHEMERMMQHFIRQLRLDVDSIASGKPLTLE